MNRENKFRGKRKLNGELVYGYFVKDPHGNYRIYMQPFDEATSNTYYFVDPETVGQLTGLKDKNGKEIYEGDIVKCHYFYEALGEGLGVYEAENEFIGHISFQDMGLWIESNTENNSVFLLWINGLHEESFEVIGNIHQNPELLTK